MNKKNVRMPKNLNDVRVYDNGRAYVLKRNSKKQTFKNFCEKILAWIFVLGLIWLVGYTTLQFYVARHPKIIINNVEVVKEINIKAKVLDRIAQCESGNKQFDPKTGQVILNANTNGSVDIGVMQINDHTWGLKAQAMGYNLTVEADNRAMADWIYQNRGTVDWEASRHCWNR